MKTMFVTNNNGVKKRFQKPNILRKKPKAPPRTNVTVNNGLIVPPLVTTTSVPNQLATKEKTLLNPNLLKNSAQSLINDNNSIGNEQGNISELYEINCNPDTQICSIFENNLIVDGNSENVSQTTINVESFLNNSVSIQNLTHIDVDNEHTSRSKEDWCIDFINNAEEIIIEDIDGSQLGCLRVAATPTVTALPLSAVSPEQGAQNTAAQPVQNLTLEYLPSSTINFQCDVPNCNKKFKSEENLNKHKVIHDKNAKLVLMECPVKKSLDNSKEEPCGRICNSKDDLVKHLNDEHNPEDAMFICWECGRRFFWVSGLRAHARVHGARAAPLACGWPGCERRFRQPCRLREHMRKHTGDKPYPCHFPNCGWSFRTASKLMRHARVHTGERRHACGQCARAFRRREHLRDHAARAHSATHARADAHPRPHACQYEGCTKMFSSAVALKTHLKKIHKIYTETNTGSEIEEVAKINSAVERQEYLPTVLHDTQIEETYVVHVDPPASSMSIQCKTQAIVCEGESTEETVDSEEMASLEEIAIADTEEMVELGEECSGVGSWRAARTHCPWPHAARAPASPAAHAQVELSEGSESNIYTIRSDLFLHGNVLNNEDSEHMPGAESSLLVVPTESDLGLLDAHPTIDLMQEELMYTDSAVDESSFRVLLLNGEDLS